MSNYSGHSGRHDGLQQHSVGGCYPYAVVTYGHDPAIHVVENLTTGAVACFQRAGAVRQWLSAEQAFAFCNKVADGYTAAETLLGPIKWVVGRPRFDNEFQRLVMPASVPAVKQSVNKRRLKFAESLEESRIGRPLTEYEVYQLACDLDNR